MDERLDRLLAIVEQQQVTIVAQGDQILQQAQQIGMLVQSVAMLLGEELGAPIAEDEPTAPRMDLDGDPY